MLERRWVETNTRSSMGILLETNALEEAEPGDRGLLNHTRDRANPDFMRVPDLQVEAG